MNTETEKFSAIYTEIQQEFANDPYITVEPAAGDPPSKYEVTYSIPSTIKDPDGNITIANEHKISIIIPFGFPHFSPSCKPLSPIFHPDVDSAAICLGNYWNRERTLPELIRYIRTMLLGEIFSTENAFNQEAVTWYEEHKDQLPFATLETESETASSHLESHSEDTADFDENLQFSAESQAAEQFDTASLLDLLEQKHFWQLDTTLSQLDDSITFPEKQQLVNETSETLSKARKLFRQAEEYEENGNSQKAMEAFIKVRQLVADYPGIKDHIKRTKLSADVFRGINDDIAEQLQKKPAQEKDPADTTAPETSPEEEGPSGFLKSLQKKFLTKTKDTEKKSRIFEERSKKSFNLTPFIVIAAVCCVGGVLTFYYSTLSEQFAIAQQLYVECSEQFSKKDFHAAEKSCLASLDTTSSIFVFHGAEKKVLQASIRKILNSEELQQGLMGNILHKGRYISSSLLEAHKLFFAAKDKADSFFAQQLWDEAIVNYKDAVRIARNTRDIPATELVAIEKRLEQSTIQITLQGAERAISQKQWSRAVKILTDLEKKLSMLEQANSNPELQEKIRKLLAEGQFVKLKTQADLLFSQSDWGGALEMFQRAIAAGQSLSGAEQGTIDSMQQDAAKAELYSTINAGNTAFTSGQWNDAITHYQKAKQLLTTNPMLKKLEDNPSRQRQLARIILQAALLRERQTADQHKEKGNYNAALRNIQDMINLIEYSEFNRDPEFIKSRNEIKRNQASLRNERFIAQLQQYLLDNYISLFVENYSAANRDTLTEPEAIFIKRLKDKYLFKLQCTETGRGRPLTLIMYYTYTPGSDVWEFYSSTQ